MKRDVYFKLLEFEFDQAYSTFVGVYQSAYSFTFRREGFSFAWRKNEEREKLLLLTDGVKNR